MILYEYGAFEIFPPHQPHDRKVQNTKLDRKSWVKKVTQVTQ